MKELYAIIIRKELTLKKLGFKVIFIWDHEFRQEKINNEDLSRFFKSVDVRPVLNPEIHVSGVK